MTGPRRILSKTFFTALCLIMALPAAAQVVLEEVVVTAQKRDESLMEVGIAITAVTDDVMRAFGIERSFDVAKREQQVLPHPPTRCPR